MPASSAKYRALKQISALLTSGSDLGDPVDLALELARKALGAGTASLVRIEEEPARMTARTAARERGQGISAKAQQAALGVLDDPTGGHVGDGIVVAATTSPSGEKIVLVCEGAKDCDQEFLHAVVCQLMLSVAAERERRKSSEAELRAEKRLVEVATIYEIGQAIQEMEIERLLEMVTAKASAAMNAEACSLMLRDAGTDQLVIRSSFGLSDDVVKGTKVAYGQGIAGRVAQTGEPMLLVDVTTDPRFAGSDVASRTDVASSICVPLKDGDGRVQGVLSIRRHKPSAPFTESDLRLFSIFASQAALAISNTQLYDRLQKQLKEISTISELVRATNSTLDLGTVLSMIADSLVGVVGFDRCCVYLLDPRTNELVAGMRRAYEDFQIEPSIRVGEGVVGIAAKERIPIFAEEPSSGSPILAAPMVVRDECIGVVLVDNHPTGRPIQQTSVDLLSTFVNQAGIAVENARLYEAMEEKYAELNMLYEHGRAIGAAYGLDRASQMLMDVAKKAARADGGMLLLLNEKRNELSVKACSGSCIDVREKVEAAAAEPDAAQYVRSLRGPESIAYTDNLDRCRKRLVGPVLPRAGAGLVVPLVSEDANVGALVLVTERAEFQAGETKLISIVTSHAAAVIRNAISYEHRMQRKVLELTALHEFSERISSAASLGEALDSILAMVGQIVECDESYICAIDLERGVLVPKASRLASGMPRELPEEPLEGNAVASWAIRERKALVSPDISADPRFAHMSLGDRQVRSLMSIPLMVQEEVVAVLNVHSYRPSLYSEDEVRVLSIIASQGAAIYKELEALSALTSYTDNILSSVAAGVITLDSDGLVLTWNRAAAGIIGIEPERVVGMPFPEVVNGLKIDEADKATTVATVMRVFRSGEVYQGYKVCFHPENKDEMYLNMSISPLLNSGGEQLGLVIIFEDVSREIKMEDEFRRMGELAAVGQLAASIAHELRNPLSSIKGAAQLLREQYHDHPTIVEFLGIILEEVDTLSKLTTEFLDFARPMQLELKPFDINNVVRKTLLLMNVQIMENRVTLTEKLSHDLPTIEADEKQIEQVLRNMILNALQAMPGGGSLEISTGRPLGRSDGVSLSVTDSGVGIPEGKLDRIFIPFFTTKTKGTGLGLSVVQKIVEHHGGRIEVSSEVGRGTTFQVILPERAAAPLTPIKEPEDERRDAPDVPRGIDGDFTPPGIVPGNS